APDGCRRGGLLSLRFHAPAVAWTDPVSTRHTGLRAPDYTAGQSAGHPGARNDCFALDQNMRDPRRRHARVLPRAPVRKSAWIEHRYVGCHVRLDETAVIETEAFGRKSGYFADRLLERQRAPAYMLAHDPGEGAEASPVRPAAHVDAVGGANVERVGDGSLEDRLAIHRLRPVIDGQRTAAMP